MATPPPPPSGTTSACAENTFAWLSPPAGVWNYLRVRGEYLAVFLSNLPIAELPPRARRIRVGADPIESHQGTTSACAENTRLILNLLIGFWNYLRVRGEY